jgi:hypothetical protein
MGSNSHQKWPVCSLAKWNMFFFWCLPWDFAIHWAWVGPHSDSDSWNESASDVTPALYQ